MEAVIFRYRLPNLLSLFPEGQSSSSKNNPHFYELDTNFNHWLESLNLAEHLEMTLKKIQMPVLICYAYPDASLAQLQTCLDYLTLAFIFEEITDTTSAAQSQKWADIYMDMYRGACSLPPGSEEVSHPLFAAMQSLASSVMTAIDPIYHESFITENLASVQAIVQEAIDREIPVTRTSSAPRTLEAYYSNRFATVGLVPFLILAQWIHGINLADYLADSPSIQDMSRATVEMVFLANDIYSFKKEKMANATQNNVITVIMQDQSTGIRQDDLQGSFEYAYGLFEKALARLHGGHESLADNVSIQSQYMAVIDKYTQAMMDCAVGNIKWSMVCRRYAVFDDEQKRAVGEITI